MEVLIRDVEGNAPPHYTIFISNTPLQKPVKHFVEEGVSLEEALQRIIPNHWEDVYVELGGGSVLKSDWADTHPKSGDILAATLSPQVSGAVVTTILISAAIGAVVGYFLFKLLAPDAPDNQSSDTFNRITGDSNSSRRFEPVGALLGRKTIVPDYAANPYTQVVGDDEWYKILLCAGAGPIALDTVNGKPDLRVGDTPLSAYPSNEYRVAAIDHYTFKGDSAVDAIREIWPADVIQQSLSFTLKTGEAASPASVPLLGAEHFSIDYLLPQGLYRVDSKGKNQSRMVKWNYQYQDPASGEWLTVARVYTVGSSDIAFREFYNESIVRVGGTLYLQSGGQSLFPIPSANVVYNSTEGVEYIILRGGYTNVASRTFNATTTRPRRFSFRHKLVNLQGQSIAGSGINTNVQVRSKKVSPSETPDDNKSIDELQWTAIRGERPASRKDFLESVGFNRPPIILEDGTEVDNFKPVIIALEIKATDNFSNMLNNLNIDATQCVPSNWDADWRRWPSLPLKTTQNPADAYRWVMQGPMQMGVVRNERLALDELKGWRDFCDSQAPEFENYRVSEYLTSESTVLSLLSRTAFAGRAEFSFIDGKYGVVVNDRRDYPVQIFTPKNSWGLSSARQYPEVVDGIKFEWDNELADYQKDEGVFKDPRVVAGNRPMVGKFSSVSYANIPSHDLAYRHTRFKFFEDTLQREAFKLSTGLEGLVAQRGDMVLLQNDVLDIGIGSGRVMNVIDDNTFRGDETIDADSHTSIGITFRSRWGDIYDVVVASFNPSTGLFTTNTPIPDKISQGDFYTYGELGKETQKCVVKQIEYKEDLTVDLLLVNYDEGVFDNDSETIPVFNTGLTTRVLYKAPAAPTLDTNNVGIDLNNGYAYVNVNYDVSEESPIQSITLQVRSYDEGDNPSELFDGDNDGWDVVDVIPEGGKIFQVSPIERGRQYQFRARVRGISLMYSPWSDISTVLTVGRDAPPEDVDGLELNTTPEGLILSWNQSEDISLSGYEVRTNTNAGDVDGLITRTQGLSLNLGFPVSGVYYVYAFTTFGVYSVGSQGVFHSEVITPTVRDFTSRTIDNTVLLDWIPPLNPPFPITHYEIRRTFPDNVEGWEAATVVGTFTGTFAVVPEQSNGLYIYYIKAVDASGSTSEAFSVRVNVDAPPDFILRSDSFLDFSQAVTESVGIISGGEGGFKAVYPIFENRTYLERVQRIDVEDNGGMPSTKQDKINAGWTRWLHPTKQVDNCNIQDPSVCPTTAYLEKIIDFNVVGGGGGNGLLAGTRVTVQEEVKEIEAPLAYRVVIAASADGLDWDQSAEGRQAFFANFRYIRVRIFFDTPALVGSEQYGKAYGILENIRVKLDVKQRTQQGVRIVNASDIGGTPVTLDSFIDIESIVATVEGDETAFAVVVFEDVINPNEFRIKAFDNTGQRIGTAQDPVRVSWIARGV